MNDSFRLAELRKAVILLVTVYYRERIPIKISEGQKHMGWGDPGETRYKLPEASSWGNPSS